MESPGAQKDPFNSEPHQFNRYVTRVRTKIREAGFTNPAYENKLSGIADKHPEHSDRINGILALNYYSAKAELKVFIQEVKDTESTDLKAKRKNLSERLTKQCLNEIDPKILSHLVRSEDEHKEKNSLAAERVERYQDADLDRVSDCKDIVSLIPELLTTSTAGDGWQKEWLWVWLSLRAVEVMKCSTCLHLRQKPEERSRLLGLQRKKQVSMSESQ
uniref:Uncharacterized protein n=1 Tax=Vibrio crassostreae TaxID=246167 RepID=A0A0H3ZTL4_9VIBR|nr:hypothetical protein [Vibrio crassostreae]